MMDAFDINMGVVFMRERCMTPIAGNLVIGINLEDAADIGMVNPAKIQALARKCGKAIWLPDSGYSISFSFEKWGHRKCHSIFNLNYLKSYSHSRGEPGQNSLKDKIAANATRREYCIEHPIL